MRIDTLWKFIRVHTAKRSILALGGALLLIGPAVICLNRFTEGETVADPPIVLLAPANTQTLSLIFGSLLSGSGLQQEYPAQLRPFFSTAVGRGYLSVSLQTLDDIYTLIVPLIMLFLGGITFPHDESIYGLLFSLPVRKLYLYGCYLLGSLTVCTGLVLGVYLLNLTTSVILNGADGSLTAVISVFHLSLWLYALVFTFLGATLSLLFRSRTTALTLGLIVIVLVTAVVPLGKRILSHVYVTLYREELLLKAASGEKPSDPLFKFLEGLSLTPTLAFRGILEDLPSLYRAAGSPDAPCPACRPGLDVCSRIWQRELGLLAAIGVLGLAGGALFLHKEARFD